MITMPTRRKIQKAQPTAHHAPTHLPRCPIEGKLCFPSEEAAALELVECRLKFMFRNERRRRETRSYPCDHCGAFHLTAMTVPPKSVSEGSSNGVQMTSRNPDPRQPVRRTVVRPGLRPSSGSDGLIFETGPIESGASGGCQPSAPSGGDCGGSGGGGGGGE